MHRFPGSEIQIFHRLLAYSFNESLNNLFDDDRSYSIDEIIAILYKDRAATHSRGQVSITSFIWMMFTIIHIYGDDHQENFTGAEVKNMFWENHTYIDNMIHKVMYPKDKHQCR